MYARSSRSRGNYLSGYGTRQTPQSQAISPDQISNEAGGYVWSADEWTRLRRFLILGSEGGSYYATERKATFENVEVVRSLAKSNGVRLVEEIVAISEAGRAPKNDPALYALATAISLGDKETKRAAAEALPKVARIATHLYHFVEYAETMRGWGRTMRWAVTNWYARNPEQLAYQAVKYRQRDGWSHRDLLRLAHPKNEVNASVFDWIAHRDSTFKGQIPYGMTIIEGFEAAQRAETPKETAALVRSYQLPREALLPEHLNDKDVWAALLETGMPMHAMVRNLATMTRNGILDELDYRNLVIQMLDDQAAITKSRLHPMAILIAMTTYAQGHGVRGGNTWRPIAPIVDALDGAFYKAFGNVIPTNKRIMVAIDASGSMQHGEIAGAPGLTPVKAAMAQALIFVATEPNVDTLLFDTSASWLPLSARQRLDDVVRKHPGHGRGTDVSIPMVVAYQEKKQYDGFIILSDFQTWAGTQHPAQALQAYRDSTGIQSRLASIALIANRWRVSDPKDALSFEAVGFDTATPNLVSDFIAGKM